MNDALAVAVMTGANASCNSLIDHAGIEWSSHCLLTVSRKILDTPSTFVLLKPRNGVESPRLMVGGGEEPVTTRIASTLPVEYRVKSSEECGTDIDDTECSKMLIFCQSDFESGQLSIYI